MKGFCNLLTPTILIKALVFYVKLALQKARIGDRLYSTAFRKVVAQYLQVPEVKKDWIGRLYCVVNPNLNSEGLFDTNMIIYELDQQGLQFSNRTYIEQWLLKKMRLVQDLFKKQLNLGDLFSHVAFTVEHVGPVNQDNYLVKIYPAVFDDFEYWWRKAKKRLLIYTIIAISLTAVKFIFF